MKEKQQSHSLYVVLHKNLYESFFVVVLQIIDYKGGRTLEDLVKFVGSEGKEGNTEPVEGEEPPPDVDAEEEGAEPAEGEEGEGEATEEGEAETTKDELQNGRCLALKGIYYDTLVIVRVWQIVPQYEDILFSLVLPLMQA